MKKARARLLIHALESGRLESRYFERIDRIGIVIAASQACGVLKDLESARKIQKDAAMIEAKSIYIASSLIDSFAKCGSLVDARNAFEAMESRNVVAWTSLIHGCAENGEAEAGLDMFHRMMGEGCEPSPRSIVAVLKCCSRMAREEEEGSIDLATRKKIKRENKTNKRSLARGMAIHRFLHSSVDIFVSATLIDMYASCGSVEDARWVFERIPCHNLVAWNAMILGYAEQGDGLSSLELYDRMASIPGMVPDARTIGAAIKACSVLAAAAVTSRKSCLEGSWLCEEGEGKLELEGGEGKFELEVGKQEEQSANIEHEERLQRKLTHREDKEETCTRAMLDRGKRLFTRAIELGCDSDVFLLNTVLDFYAKCGNLAEARAIFDRISQKTTVSWNALILGFVENGHPEQALDLFFTMPAAERDSTTFAAAFKACGSKAFLALGKIIHAQVCHSGADKSLVVATGVVDFYSKCGSLIEAQHTFDSMASKNTVTWTAMISGFTRAGSTKQVFDLFQEMLDVGFKPDGATLVLVITACSHAGLVARGRKIFEEVLPRQAVLPGIEHYHALIDLLGRANHLKEALEVAETMPFKPRFVTWMTLLACCNKWGNVAIANVAFQRLLEINAVDSTGYILMEKIFARKGRGYGGFVEVSK